jgi:hypothetical protein
MPQRELPVVPGEDIQSKHGDSIADRQRELEAAVVADEPRQREGADEDERESG